MDKDKPVKKQHTRSKGPADLVLEKEGHYYNCTICEKGSYGATRDPTAGIIAHYRVVHGLTITAKEVEEHRKQRVRQQDEKMREQQERRREQQRQQEQREADAAEKKKKGKRTKGQG